MPEHRPVVGHGMRLLVEDGAHTEQVTFAQRGVGEHFLRRQRGLGLVVAEDVVQGQGVRRRRYASCVNGLQALEVIEDCGKLLAEVIGLLVANGNAGQSGDVLDLIARKRQGGLQSGTETIIPAGTF